MYKGEYPYVLLYDRPSLTGATLNAVVLDEGEVALVDLDMDIGDGYKQVMSTLREIAAANMEDDDDGGDYYRD
jgi:hypothetical protein